MLRMFRRFTNCRMPCRRWSFKNRCTREALNIKEVTYNELLDKVKNGAILIDVRTKQEFLEEHLDGAILIPYYDIYYKIDNIVPNKEATIILYCKNGGRSLKAYDALNQLGYTDVYNLKGGMEDI